MEEEIKEKRKTTTSSKVKNRYNAKTYNQYKFNVRKDDELNDKIKEYKQENPQGFQKLVVGLLKKHFDL
jgi:hypothetical protein